MATEMPERSPLLLRFQSPTRPERRQRQQRQTRRRIAAIAVVGAVFALVAFTKWIYTPITDLNSTVPLAPRERLCGTTNDEAGYIQLANGVDNHYFYWFFEAQHAPETAPLAIWLTGGPGGSGFIGLLKENGPCHVVPETLTTKVNAYGWNHQANMIWLDQPTDVGFSYGAEEDFVANSTGVAENVYWFLQGFLDKHPELESREFFVTGESYAGHYIPAVAHYIHQQNQRNATDRKHIHLQGIAIGNGWTDPVLQTQHAADMVEANAYNLTLLSPDELTQMKRDIATCVTAFQTNCLPMPAANRTACFEVEISCYANVFNIVESHYARSRYDFRQVCVEDYGFCGGLPEVEAFLDQPHVRAYLGVNNTRVGKWEASSDAVSIFMTSSGDHAMSSAPLVAELLDAGLRVLIYVGDADFVCNWQGNLAWLQALAWRGHDGFNKAVEKPFLSRDPLNDQALLIHAGAVRAFENLVFLKVFNAGHMVPTHQPAVALDLINRFFVNAPFL